MPIIKGKFADIAGIDKYEAALFQDAADAITAAEAWEYIRTFSGESFMYSRSAELHEVCDGNPASQGSELSQIQAHMKMLDEHSGSSYGITMRHMEKIAKEGWESYVTWRTSR